jgi:hypothetical protein
MHSFDAINLLENIDFIEPAKAIFANAEIGKKTQTGLNNFTNFITSTTGDYIDGDEVNLKRVKAGVY